MLKKVFRNEITEGMRFSAPVFFDDGENMLVSKGVPIKARELMALDRWKIPFVLTAGNALREGEKIETVDEPEELSDLDEMESVDAPETVNPAAKGEKVGLDDLEYTSEQIIKLPEVLANNTLYKTYSDLIRDLDTVFTDIKKQRDVKTRSIDRIVSELLTVLQHERSGIVGFILGGDVEEMELAKNSINTAILSIIIGEHLGLPRHRLLQVATGALLHDIGMLKIPESIVSKEGKLDDNETQIMRSHPFYGYKLIVNDLLYADEVGKSAAQHHERWDGEGYPARLAGSNIDIGARIISVADAFEAMVSPKACAIRWSGIRR